LRKSLKPSRRQRVNIYKLRRSRFKPTVISTFPHPSLYIGDFNCQHVNWGYKKHLLMVRAWTPGQHPTTLDCYITERKQPVSSLHDGKFPPTQTWPSHVFVRKADYQTGKFLHSQHRPSLPAFTTSAFPYNATEAQGSCPQRSSEVLELSQC